MLEERNLQSQIDFFSIIFSGFPVKTKEIQGGQLELLSRQNQAQGIRHRIPIIGTGPSNHVGSCEMGRKEAGGPLSSCAQFRPRA